MDVMPPLTPPKGENSNTHWLTYLKSKIDFRISDERRK
jgi:hypothetical protein